MHTGGTWPCTLFFSLGAATVAMKSNLSDALSFISFITLHQSTLSKDYTDVFLRIDGSPRVLTHSDWHWPSISLSSCNLMAPLMLSTLRTSLAISSGTPHCTYHSLIWGHEIWVKTQNHFYAAVHAASHGKRFRLHEGVFQSGRLEVWLTCYYSSQQTAKTTIFFAVFRVTSFMPWVCFKPVTWYIEMYHVRTYFLCDVMAFSYYVMFIPNVFIFKRKAYRPFYHVECI